MSGSSEGATATNADPSDAFGALGNEIRMAILRAIFEIERADGDSPSFSDLYEHTAAETSAQFAYHLRQLTGHYVEKTEGGYTLTYAGTMAAQAMAAGTYTERVTTQPITLDESCPLCCEQALEAVCVDNAMTVACTACERKIVSLPFPPGGAGSHTDERLPRAFDRHHRHRIHLMADGYCPECGDSVETTLKSAGERLSVESSDESRVQARMECKRCGYRLRCPVTFAVLDHPEVVSFYYEAGIEVQDRPIWNVGSEWRETVLSDNPWYIHVVTTLDGKRLELIVDDSLEIIEHRRVANDETDESEGRDESNEKDEPSEKDELD
jgi:hypothetical protein